MTTLKPLSIGGREIQLDFRAWTDADRRSGSLTVMVAALGLLVLGVALQLFARSVSDGILWLLVVLVILLLAYEGLAVWWGLRGRGDAAAPPEADEEPGLEPVYAGQEAARWSPPAMEAAAPEAAEPEAAAWSPPAAAAPVAPAPAPAPAPGAGRAPQILTLKCGECATIFDVEDTGQRPLYHRCPGCGAEGVLRGTQAEPARSVDPARPINDMRAPDNWVPPDLPEPKKVKLRCGACKHVFQISDTGERPLRHRCPSCGKLGEIR